VSLDSKEQETSTPNKSMTAQTVSLLVTPDQGARLMLANEMGKIRLMMRSPEDDQLGNVARSRPSDLFEGSSAGNREKETLVEKSKNRIGQNFLEALANQRPAPQPVPVEVRPTWTVRVLEPGTVKDVVFQEVSGDASNPQSWRPINLQPSGDDKTKGTDASAGATGPAAGATPAPAGASDLVPPKPKADGAGKPATAHL
jgi:hypothetical protein